MTNPTEESPFLEVNGFLASREILPLCGKKCVGIPFLWAVTPPTDGSIPDVSFWLRFYGSEIPRRIALLSDLSTLEGTDTTSVLKVCLYPTPPWRIVQSQKNRIFNRSALQTSTPTALIFTAMFKTTDDLPILSHVKPVHFILAYFVEIHFSIIQVWKEVFQIISFIHKQNAPPPLCCLFIYSLHKTLSVTLIVRVPFLWKVIEWTEKDFNSAVITLFNL